MRKVIVGAIVSMDGVMQAPGGPEEDPTGGFKFGGWVAPFADIDPVFGEEIGKLFGEPFDLLLGRRTYDIFAAYWPYAEGGPYDDIAKTFNRITKYVATRKGVDLTLERLGRAARRCQGCREAETGRRPGPRHAGQHRACACPARRAASSTRSARSRSPCCWARASACSTTTSQPRAFKLTHSAVSPNGLIAATYVRDGEVKTATIGGAQEPSPAELARREKLKREG